MLVLWLRGVGPRAAAFVTAVRPHSSLGRVSCHLPGQKRLRARGKELQEQSPQPPPLSSTLPAKGSTSGGERLRVFFSFYASEKLLIQSLPP